MLDLRWFAGTPLSLLSLILACFSWDIEAGKRERERERERKREREREREREYHQAHNIPHALYYVK